MRTTRIKVLIIIVPTIDNGEESKWGELKSATTINHWTEQSDISY